MKVDLKIDGKTLSLQTSGDKPLNLILRDDADVTYMDANCDGNACGNCVVLIDGKAALSCLVPAYAARDKEIVTFEGFSRTRPYRDIERAFASAGGEPCPRCRASKYLLVEHILRRCESSKSDLDEAEILQEAGLVKCSCTDAPAFLAAVRAALAYRRRANARGGANANRT